MLWKLAYRNLLRHPARTAATLVAIVVGVASLILAGGFVQDSILQLGEAFIGSQTGHIQIGRTQYFMSSNQSLSEVLMPQIASLKERAASVPGVEDAMGRLTFSGVMNNGRRDNSVIVLGVEAEKEKRLGANVTILQGRDLGAADEFGAVLGEGLAHTLGLRAGDRAVLLASSVDGALNTLDIDVVGVFRSFSKDFDARAVRIPLPAAQSLLMTDQVNALVLRLDKTEHTDRVAVDLQQKISDPGILVKTWQNLSDYYVKVSDLYKRQFGVMQFIILCMVFLSVVNSINMSAYERVPEFGTMRALGIESSEVARLIFVECILLGLTGAVLGILVGIALGALISMIGIPMPPPPGSEQAFVAQIHLAPLPILFAGAIGFVAAIAASIPSALRSSRVPITDALRQAI